MLITLLRCTGALLEKVVINRQEVTFGQKVQGGEFQKAYIGPAIHPGEG